MSLKIPATPSPTPTTISSPKDEILQFQLHLAHISNKRPGHLANLAFAALKFLILNSQSDTLRMEAVKLVVSLAPVQQKLESMNRQAPRQPRTHAPTEEDNTEFLEELGVLLETGDVEKLRELGARLRRDAATRAVNGKPDASGR